MADPFDKNTLTREQLNGLRSAISELRVMADHGQELSYHQILAHASICFTINAPMEKWELVALARNLGVPMTPFLSEHISEAQDMIADEACQSYPEDVGNLQLLKLRAIASRDGQFFRLGSRRIERGLPMPDRDGVVILPDADISRKWNICLPGVNLPWRYMPELEDVNPRGELFRVLRDAENCVRRRYGIPEVGQGWVNETELFFAVRDLLPDLEVLQHGQPDWLGRQHLDIYIPKLKLAFEYQGVQHFNAVERFGGITGLKATLRRDERKRLLCQQNRVTLVEIRHDENWSREGLANLLNAHRAGLGLV